MGKWLRALFTEFVANLLIGAGGVGVVIMALLAQVPIYILLLVALGSFCLVFFGINQFHAFRERRKKGIASLNDQEIEDTIRNWVDIQAFSFQRQVAEAQLYFKFLITYNLNRKVTIIRCRDESSVIELITDVTLTPTNQSVNQSVWEKLASKLSVEMARLGIQFKFNGEPNLLERITLIEPIMIDDSLTGFYFRQRVMFVVRAIVLVQQITKETFGELNFSEPNPHKEGSQS